MARRIGVLLATERIWSLAEWLVTLDEPALASARQPSARPTRRWSPRDREQLSQLGAGVLSGAPQLCGVRLLSGFELRLLAVQPTLGLGDLHVLPGPHLDQVRFNSAIIARTLNSSRPTGSVGSCTESSPIADPD